MLKNALYLKIYFWMVFDYDLWQMQSYYCSIHIDKSLGHGRISTTMDRKITV
jgi:hypothetical protein